MVKSAFIQIVLLGSVLALHSLAVQAQNITTVVGGGIPSPASGTSFSAGLVTAVAVDPTSGDLYFADATHGFIYSVNAQTGVSRLVETGSPITEFLYFFPLAHPDAIHSLAADGKGHLYIADPAAGFVYELATSGGTIQVVAGCGTLNNPSCHGQQTVGDGGAATSAYLSPASVAVDGSGNLFIADPVSCRIRKVTAGTISTVAGSSTCGYSGDGMAATLAQLNAPVGVAVDGKENIFIADSGVVREVCASSAGPCGGPNNIQTIAGGGGNDPSKGGPATATALAPVAVSVDSSGNLYITENDWYSGTVARVSLINTSSSPITIAPPAPTLPGCSSPVTPELVLPGSIQTLAGSGQSGYMSIAPCQTSPPEGIPAMYTTLNYPYGVAVGGGLLLIADTANFRVRAVNLTGTPVSPFGVQQSIQPYYVRTVVGNGQEESVLNGSLPTEIQLGTPSAVVEDAALNIYIGENPSRIIEVKTAAGGVSTIAGTGVLPNTPEDAILSDGKLAVAAELPSQTGLFLDNLDDVLTADNGGGAQAVNTSDQSRIIYGTSVGGGDIQNLAPTLPGSLSLASDNASNLYLNDGEQIIATDPSMIIGASGGNNDPGYPIPASVLGDKGLAAKAVFGSIVGQCLDASGNMFITDNYSLDVRLIAIGSQGTVGAVSVQPNYIDSVAGNSGRLPPSPAVYPLFSYIHYFQHAYYTAEQIGDGGPATSAFVAPAGCFVDNLGNIFLADAGNDRIRRIDRKSGYITTVAGGQYPGFSGDGGPAVDASLNSPSSVWGDQAGNLLIADSGNHRIRQISGILPVPNATVSSSECSLSNPSPGAAVQVTLTNSGSAPLILSSPPALTNSKDFSMSTSGCEAGLPGLAPNPTNASGIPNSACTVALTSVGGTASTEVMFFDNALTTSPSSGVTVAPDPNNSGQASGYIQSKFIEVYSAATPTITLASGTYTQPTSTTITDFAGTNLFYCTSASGNCIPGTPYMSAVPINAAPTEYVCSNGTACGYTQSATVCHVYTNAAAAATPTFSPASGTYTTAQTVKLADATAGATIYYTTNGSTPTTSSTKYTAAITVSATETIKAIATATGMSSSAVGSAAYTISIPAATPTITLASGTYTMPTSTTITDFAGTNLFYCTSASGDCTPGTAYTSAVTINAVPTEYVCTNGTATGYTLSATVCHVYTNAATAAAATPTFSPAAGTYTSTQIVKLADATAGATIYYTTNGTAPTTASTPYTAAITVGSTEKIEAIAVAPGYTSSAIAHGTFTITAATPTFSPAAGTYTSAQTVMLADATAGATIYYTTNGSTPTTSSTKYTAAVTVSATETIQAIAVATGLSSSAVASAIFTIN